MSKINYRQCDICGDKVEWGKHIFLSLFSKVDICHKCSQKLHNIIMDEYREETMISAALDSMPNEYRKEENNKLQAAYLEGMENAINQLFKHKVCKSR